MLDLSLGSWRIWYEKVWAAIYLVPRDARILENLSFEKKLLHDEFMYDESLNSYHNYIFMLARLGKPAHKLLVLYWVWSNHVRPLLRGWSYSQDQDHVHSTHICCFYPESTHPHAFHLDPPQNYSTPTLGVNIKNMLSICFIPCYIIKLQISLLIPPINISKKRLGCS
jgi:hypothetical protein